MFEIFSNLFEYMKLSFIEDLPKNEISRRSSTLTLTFDPNPNFSKDLHEISVGIRSFLIFFG